MNNTDWQGLGGQRGVSVWRGSAAGGRGLRPSARPGRRGCGFLGRGRAWKRLPGARSLCPARSVDTGGAFRDPGGRGRWHFGPPRLDRADIEGFREIFPDNGAAATALPVAFLGLEPVAEGLTLAPWVPSALDGFEVTGLGYAGAVWTISVRAARSTGQAAQLKITFKRMHGPAHGWGVRCGTRTTSVSTDQSASAVVTVPAGTRITLARQPEWAHGASEHCEIAGGSAASDPVSGFLPGSTLIVSPTRRNWRSRNR